MNAGHQLGERKSSFISCFELSLNVVATGICLYALCSGSNYACSDRSTHPHLLTWLWFGLYFDLATFAAVRGETAFRIFIWWKYQMIAR